MPTTAPFVKLLRQLSRARDEYRSGALDLSWDGGESSLYLVFGQPNHATYAGVDGEAAEGPEALTALLNHLPRKFTVEPWRKTVVRDGTLKMSLDELMEPFAQLAGASSPDTNEEVVSPPSGIDVGTEYAVDFTFGLEDFPLMPAGQSMFTDAAVRVVHLDLLLPKLPPSIIVLTGPKLRAAAVVVNGQLIDAVWVDDQSKAAGEGAAMAIMGARDGTISGYRLNDARMAEAITMLWRCPERYSNLSLAWLDGEDFLESIGREKRDCALVVRGPEPGAALFLGGELVGVYSLSSRRPEVSMDRVRQLLKTNGTLSILQRSGDPAVGRHIQESDYHVMIVDKPEPEEPQVTYEQAATEMVPEHAEEFNLEAEHEHAMDSPLPEWAQNEEVAPVAEAGVAAEPALEAYAPPQADPDVEETLAPVDFNQQPSEVPQPELPHTNGESAETIEAEPTPLWSLNDPEEEPAAAAPAAEAEPPLAPELAEPEEEQPDLMGTAAQHPEPQTQPQPEAEPKAAPPAPAEPAPSWGLARPEQAEPEPQPAPSFFTDFGGAPAFEPAAQNTEALAAPAAASTSPHNGDGAESSGVDFNAIRNDLVQIGILWLGEKDVATVAGMISETSPNVDAFVKTIDQIKGITVEGHDPSVIRAMAREMQYHAAEFLSGA